MSLTGPINMSPAGGNYGYLPVIPQGTRLASDYFRQGRDLPAGARNQRFYEYRRLYEGETDRVFNRSQYPIINNHRNYFAEVADSYYRFLMAFPPESGSALMPMLIRELRNAIIDYYVHGVAIMAAEPGLIEAIDPRYFYLVEGLEGANDYAVLRPLGSKRLAIRRGTSETVFAFENMTSNFLYPQGILGEREGEQAVPERQYFTTGRNPDDDIFGSSLVRDMLPAVSARTEAISSYLTQMKISSNILHIEEADLGGVQTQLTAQEAEDHSSTQLISLAQMLGRAVMNVSLMEFVSGQVDSDAYQKLLNEFETEIWNVSGISPSLAAQFNDQNVLIQSGVAYERSFLRTSLELSEVIDELRPMLEAALTAAGAPGDITWENPLRQLDMEQRQAAPVEGSGDAE